MAWTDLITPPIEADIDIKTIAKISINGTYYPILTCLYKENMSTSSDEFYMGDDRFGYSSYGFQYTLNNIPILAQYSNGSIASGYTDFTIGKYAFHVTDTGSIYGFHDNSRVFNKSITLDASTDYILMLWGYTSSNSSLGNSFIDPITNSLKYAGYSLIWIPLTIYEDGEQIVATEQSLCRAYNSNNTHPTYGTYQGMPNVNISNSQWIKGYSGMSYLAYISYTPSGLNTLNFADLTIYTCVSCTNTGTVAIGNIGLYVFDFQTSSYNGLDVSKISAQVTSSTSDYPGDTGTGGGSGTFSDDSDNISIPSIPDIDPVLDSGFANAFKMSSSNLHALSTYMWSDAFDIESFKKIFANPMDCVISLTVIPCNPSGTPSNIYVGNISTGVSGYKLTSQWYTLDCGTIYFTKYFGSYLDFEPYTTVSLYLPYIGTVPISTDDVQKLTSDSDNGDIHVVYHIDVVTGTCVAYVQCNGTIAYTFTGQCGVQIPFTGNDFTSTYQGILSAVGGIAKTISAFAGGDIGGGLSGITSTASSVIASKPSIGRSGNMGGTAGLLGVQTPYLIIRRPKQAVAFLENGFTGYPSHITYMISDLIGTGFTKCEEIILSGFEIALKEEIDEIMNLMKTGVYL